ncbi:amino acid permease [Pseudovibrio sp. Tun.PSC04-5.I4]|uniref:APC family permease n=1 Tax=Pseudovibrio sp. Tun.PSC04-5.I4 TaxID=1798213 RepID=UPI000886648C|nr:amino acid permease [Pseudovibrio sp. Tun.PSC04-5.I4]SDQ19943.1 amino acid/polyamine/organocation transporter, APC superfamily [Pseudovibrio sp. Tun.PSC04-5.I4]
MSELKQTVGTLRGAGLMLNIVIGAGLLALPGLVVKQAGDQALWAWGVCALAALPLLLVFIVMGRRFPNAGGIAHFAEVAFGRNGYGAASLLFLGAVIFGLPAIALTGGYYLQHLIPANPTVLAAGIIIAATTCHLVSTEIVGRISSAIASFVLLALILLISIGFTAIDWSSVAQTTRPFSQVQPAALVAPFMMIFFAFTGWEVAAGISEEFKNPRRDFPRAMALSFVLACLLYFAMAFVAQNVVTESAGASIFAAIAENAFGRSGEVVISAIASLIIFANLVGAIWAVSRMLLSLSREGLLPLGIGYSGSGPSVTVLLLTSGALLLVLSLDWANLIAIETMLAVAGQNFLILYGLASLSLLRLSKALPEKLLALTSIFIVGGILAYQGASLLYPVFLIVLGIIFVRMRDELGHGKLVLKD